MNGWVNGSIPLLPNTPSWRGAPTQWVPGTLSQGVKRPECEADHSSPSSAQVKNAWNNTSVPSIAPLV
jgi:hypothetical protein